MAKQQKTLKRQHFQAMTLRLNGYTIKQIAEEMGRKERTIKSWFYENDFFRSEFSSMKEEMRLAARAKIIGNAPTAASRIVELMDDLDSKVALSAAKDILDRSGLKPVQEVKHEGDINISNPYEGLSTEELKRLAKLGDGDAK